MHILPIFPFFHLRNSRHNRPLIKCYIKRKFNANTANPIKYYICIVICILKIRKTENDAKKIYYKICLNNKKNERFI